MSSKPLSSSYNGSLTPNSPISSTIFKGLANRLEEVSDAISTREGRITGRGLGVIKTLPLDPKISLSSSYTTIVYYTYKDVA